MIVKNVQKKQCYIRNNNVSNNSEWHCNIGHLFFRTQNEFVKTRFRVTSVLPIELGVSCHFIRFGWHLFLFLFLPQRIMEYVLPRMLPSQKQQQQQKKLLKITLACLNTAGAVGVQKYKHILTTAVN